MPQPPAEFDQIASLPFTEKDELRKSQAEHPPLGDHLAAPRASLARIFSTSGTTGDPVPLPVTKSDLAMWIEISSRSYFATGIRPGMTVVSTFNAGPFVAGAALDTMVNLGTCHVPIGTGNTARIVRALELIGPEVLLCTPSYAIYLAEHLAERGIAANKLGLKRISVARRSPAAAIRKSGRVSRKRSARGSARRWASAIFRSRCLANATRKGECISAAAASFIWS